MSTKKLVFLFINFLPLCSTFAQIDSSLLTLKQLPDKYLKATEKKIDQYTNRISTETEKSLTRLCRWEDKIHQVLRKINPEAATKLFSNDNVSFKQMLAQYKKGESVIHGYKAGYDDYTDRLSTQVDFLDSNRKLLKESSQKLLLVLKEKNNILEDVELQTQALQKRIKERKRQLTNEAIKYLGKNKHLQKINKESYYYTETLKNYKQILKNKTKREETVKGILDKIPAFKNFVKKNSMLASLFGLSVDDAENSQSLIGLQTRLSANNQIQGLIASGGPNAGQMMQQNMQQAHAEMIKLKEKIEKAGSSESSELPDFKPNNQKTKTFMQRLEYGIDMQPQKGSSYIPGGINVGANMSYKINDKSAAGIGLAYKLGIGNIQRIKFTNEGLGLRSFLDWKLKKQFYITGGYELNQIRIDQSILANNAVKWQRSGLIGVSKKYNVGKRSVKTQLLWDFLSYQQVPVTQPIILRFGIPLK